MKMRTLICIGFILCLSCGKKKPNYAIDSGLKAAFNYKIGSYWIYRDSITGKVDSMVVTNNTIKQDEEANYTVEHLTIYIRAYPNPDSNTDWQLDFWKNTCELSCFNSVNGVEAGIGYPILFVFPFKIGPYNNGIGSLTNIYDKFSLNDSAYSNTAEVHELHSTGLVGSLYDDRFYINTSTGIIKIKLNHPQDSLRLTLTLLRSKILK